MEHALSTPFIDVSADELCYRLDADPVPALATLELSALGGTVQLRLLGASHQVIVAAPGVALSELVSCGYGEPGLPARRTERYSAAEYAFTATVSVASTALVAVQLRERFTDDPSALVGEFPGTPDALTVLAAGIAPGRLDWRTWHLYPQAGHVVHTASTLTLTPQLPTPGLLAPSFPTLEVTR